MKYTFTVFVSVEAEDSSVARTIIDDLLLEVPYMDSNFDFSIEELRSEG